MFKSLLLLPLMAFNLAISTMPVRNAVDDLLPGTTLKNMTAGIGYGCNSGENETFFFEASCQGNEKWTWMRDETVTNDIKAHVTLNGSYTELSWIKNMGGNRYHFYFDGYTPTAGDEITLKEGLKIYQWSGAFDGNHETTGEGTYNAVAEFKKDLSFVYTGEASNPWVISLPEAKLKSTTPTNVGFYENYFYLETQSANDVQWVWIRDEAVLGDILSHVSVNGSHDEINPWVANMGGNRYQLYLKNTTFADGDIITLEKGLKIYQWSGSVANNEATGNGAWYPIEEFKEDISFVYNSGAWNYVLPAAELKNTTPGNAFGKGDEYNNYFFFETKMPNNVQWVWIRDTATLNDISAHVNLNGSHDAIQPWVGNWGCNRYHLYWKDTALNDGDILTLEQGLKIYQWSGTVENNEATGAGSYVAVEELKEDIKFVYNASAAEWKIYQAPIPAAELINQTPNNGFGVNDGYFFFMTKANNDLQWVAINDTTTLADIKSHISIAGSYDRITGVNNWGGARYHIWWDSSYVPADGDQIILKAGLKMYQYDGTVTNNQPQGDGEFFAAEEFKEDVKFAYNGSAGIWEMYTEPLPAATLKNQTAGDAFGSGSVWGATFYFETQGTNIDQYIGITAADTPVAYANAKDHITIRGSHEHLSRVVNLGGNRYHLYCEGGYSPLPGDILVLEAGLKIYQWSGDYVQWTLSGDGEFIAVEEFKEDIKFIYTGASSGPWQLYNSSYDVTDFTLSAPKTEMAVGAEMQLTWTLTPETAVGTPTFTSSDETVATISADGKVTGLKEGSVTITATIGSVSKTLTISVAAPKQIKSVVATNTPNYYSVLKGSDPKDFKPNITSYKLVFEDNTMSPEYTCDASKVAITGTLDTSKVGESKLGIKITHTDNVQYAGEINVKVYAQREMKISEVALVDWFNMGTFIEFPNTSTNLGNFTSGEVVETLMSKISYKRANGSAIELKTVYQLGDNIALFPAFLYNEKGEPKFNKINWEEALKGEHYKEGDMITIAEKTPMHLWTGDLTGGEDHILVPGTGEAIVEGYIEHETIYRFNGNIWTKYEKFEDIKVANENLELSIGQTVSSGFSRYPETATEGVFSYKSDNEAVATVNSSGMITGVGEGTAHITATLTSQEDPTRIKTKVLTVTVKDGITEVKIKNATSDNPLKVTVGNELDLSKFEAVAVYGSGKEEAISLEGAKVENFNKDELGIQTLAITVNVGGKEYVLRATVEVVEVDNTAAIVIASAAGGTVVVGGGAAGVTIFLKKRKKLK